MRVRTHTNPFNYYHPMTPVQLSKMFQDPTQPLDLEIGFGRGVFLREWAKSYEGRNIIGVEIRKSMVDILNDRIAAQGLAHNTHLIHSSGERVLIDMIPDQSLDTIFVFHPDPWFKKRHHKRRFIRPEIVSVMAQKLKVGGFCHLSSDVPVLWAAMQETLSESASFSEVPDHPFWETDYTSHWHQFSQETSRSLHYGTYCLRPNDEFRKVPSS